MQSASDASGSPGLAHDGEQRQGREDPVPGGRVVGEQQVTRLLAAQVGAQALHLLVHVAVADLRLHHLDAGGAERLVEPEIGHDRGDHGVDLQALAAGHVTRRDGQHVVTVADLAGVIDRDQPIAVAVEGEPEVGARGAQALAEPVGMQARRSRR